MIGITNGFSNTIALGEYYGTELGLLEGYTENDQIKSLLSGASLESRVEIYIGTNEFTILKFWVVIIALNIKVLYKDKVLLGEWELKDLG